MPARMEVSVNEKLKKAFEGDLTEYKSIPFWSWNNSMDEGELVKQIDEMYEAGIGGFIMHARTGLKDEYLGEKWFSCIAACLKRAKELKMNAWVYDENGWPSGFVGGKLLAVERFRARFLEYKVGAFDKDAYGVFVADEKAGFIRVTEELDGVAEYHNVYLRVSPANTDILNPEVVEAFISETHEKYYERFSESFGKELTGFFTDEPQYYRWATPYTPCAEEEFKKLGKDVRDGLVWLFVEDERGYEFRELYYKTLNYLYTENFYKRLYDWCEEHGCQLTGHSVEESVLSAQMWGGAAVMPSYAYEHIPAIDKLGRSSAGDLSSRQVSSVTAQMGKKQILTETFGCAGYDVTPKELKSVAESQYFRGVNLMCQHLYPYSIAGQGKVDHPPVFGPHGNWGNGFKTFNDYFTRLGYLVANTQEQVDLAIVHPQRDIWLDHLHGKRPEGVKKTEETFCELLKRLRQNGITYHLLDEYVLERFAKNEGNGLRVGECKYDCIVVPKMRNISAPTYELLKNYKGKLCVLANPQLLDGKQAELPLKGNFSLDEALGSGKVKFFCEDGKSFVTARASELGEFLFVRNDDMNESSRIVMQGVAEEYRALDLMTLAEYDISNDMTLAASESIVLVKSEGAKPTEYTVEKTDVTSSFAVTDITENYLVLDYAQVKKGEGAFSPVFPIPGIFEHLVREDYKGEITVRQTFKLQEKMPLTLMMERAKWKNICVNGQTVDFRQSDYDLNFVEADITSAVKEGENELVYTIDFWQHDGVHFALFDPLATESLRNCLYYDTSIETAYLKGGFVVNEDKSLAKRKTLPAVNSMLKAQGYPFFKGQLTMQGEVEYDGKDRAIFGIEGRFLVAELTVNGKRAELTLDTEQDITELLKVGKNDVTVCLRSSLRNLMGPFHFRHDGDLLGVSPPHFSFRGAWKGETEYPEKYSDEYNLVPFGADAIYLKKKRVK